MASLSSRWVAIGGVAAVAACHVAASAYFAHHNPYQEQIFAPCPVLALTGWQCPGCGGTRALYSLLHGDVVGAAAMNPLLLALYAAAAVLVASFTVTARARPRLGNGLALTAVGLVVSAGLYSGVIRNLLGG